MVKRDVMICAIKLLIYSKHLRIIPTILRLKSRNLKNLIDKILIGKYYSSIRISLNIVTLYLKYLHIFHITKNQF